jgi:hypothetical protein
MFVKLPPTAEFITRKSELYEILCKLINESLNVEENHGSRLNTSQVNAITNNIDILDNIAEILTKHEIQTIVVEKNYIDRNYLRDFQRYHLSCYQHYKKSCNRIHFFKNSIQDFNEKGIISVNTLQKHINDLQSAYVGFIVIRPLTRNFIGRTAIIPLEIQNQNETLHLIKNNNTAHLFGITFKIKTLLFLEQDRSVGACSPTSLWIALNGLRDKWELGEIPAVSELIEMNVNTYEYYNRSFPNMGLYVTQLEFLIKKFGLEPDYIAPKQFYNPKQLLYAYLSADIPVMIEIEYCEKINIRTGKDESIINKDTELDEEKFTRKMISHMAVVSGYKINNINEKTIVCDSETLLSDNINTLFIHDDRRGPYQEADLIKKTIIIDDVSEDNYILNYLMKSNSDSSGIWLLKGILIPSHSKIRVSYIHVSQLFLNFLRMINTLAIFFVRNELKHLNSIPEIQLKLDSILQNDLSKIISPNNIWNIQLITTNKYKSQVLQDLCLSRPEKVKRGIIQDILPRFFWLIQGIDLKTHSFVMEIVIDATDIDPPLKFYRIWVNESYQDTFQMYMSIFQKSEEEIDHDLLNQVASNWKGDNFENLGTIKQIILDFFKDLRIKFEIYN